MTSTTLSWPALITELLDGEDLSVAEAEWAMTQFMQGEATPAQQAAFLIALNRKGPRVEELIGFRDAILREANRLDVTSDALDIVGTGGDRIGTVNVSTTATIVCAAAGIPMIKHGNKAASSKSGSSNILSALGAHVALSTEQIIEVFHRAGMTFVHAGSYFPGFRHVAPTRKELGVPTVFNFLGPLCNPARPEASAIGVADAKRAPLIAGVFQHRGATALVFRGDDGLDELTTTGHSRIWEVTRGTVTEHDLDPEEIGIPRATIQDLLGGTPEENAEILRKTLAGEAGPVRDIVLLNAAAGITAYDLSRDPKLADEDLRKRLRANLGRAAEAIDSGKATQKLNDWVDATVSVASGATD